MLETRIANDAKRRHRFAQATAQHFYQAASNLNLEFDEDQQATIDRLGTPTPHGFYIWGEVGRGKSMLAHLYFDAVPTTRKKHFHFHNFFRDLQAEIMSTKRPIEDSIHTLIGDTEVVFFDEFHVHDVADAVYLTKTLEALIEHNVFVLATSNYAPEGLMPDPLFHERFAPAIALIKSRFEVIALGDGVDYRRVPANRGHSGFGAGRWQINTVGEPAAIRCAVNLNVNGHTVQAVSAEPDTAIFTFAELCERPLGTHEYLHLAEGYERIQLIGVPDLATVSPSAMMRLCNLVDVLYHCDLQFDVEAFAEPERMRDAVAPPRDAARTLSRLAALKLVPQNSRGIAVSR